MTAEEFITLNVIHYTNEDHENVLFDSKEVFEKMIEFAKYHVEQALKAASEKATGYYYGQEGAEFDAHVDKDTIINAYPLENIK